jgi:glucose/mannose-6-phosphate isomerase
MSSVHSVLDDAAETKRRDEHHAADVLRAFPEQCRRATRLVAEPATARVRPRVLVIVGMGGSAAGGDLLAACAAERLDVPVIVHRGYGLPAFADSRTLVLACSYSGETAEVVSSAEHAIARDVPMVAITTGGRLGRLAAQHGLPRVTLPGGLMPRMALGYLFFPALAVLRSVEVSVVRDDGIAEALDVIEAQAVELGPDRPTEANEAKQLAVAIDGRLPAIYGGPDTALVAYRWKTDVQENAKALALAGALPEMNHNEIEAWRKPAAAALHLVLLRDAAEPAEIARRFSILRELVDGVAGGVSEAWTRGQGRLARLLSLVYLGQWTSYYLALLREVDPWTVPLLDELKRRLQGRAEC